MIPVFVLSLASLPPQGTGQFRAQPVVSVYAITDDTDKPLPRTHHMAWQPYLSNRFVVVPTGRKDQAGLLTKVRYSVMFSNQAEPTSDPLQAIQAQEKNEAIMDTPEATWSVRLTPSLEGSDSFLTHFIVFCDGQPFQEGNIPHNSYLLSRMKLWKDASGVPHSALASESEFYAPKAKETALAIFGREISEPEPSRQRQSGLPPDSSLRHAKVAYHFVVSDTSGPLVAGDMVSVDGSTSKFSTVEPKSKQNIALWLSPSGYRDGKLTSSSALTVGATSYTCPWINTISQRAGFVAVSGPQIKHSTSGEVHYFSIRTHKHGERLTPRKGEYVIELTAKVTLDSGTQNAN